MTTPNEELRKLAENLRDAELSHPKWLAENAFKSAFNYATAIELLDALQSQAERIATLEDDVESLQKNIDTTCSSAAELIAKCFAERDALRAELAAIAATEPVAWFFTDIQSGDQEADTDPDSYTREVATGYKRKQPLFTRPMPAESKDAERYRWLRDYLISPSTHFDDLIVSADKADTLDGVIDAARAKGAKQ